MRYEDFSVEIKTDGHGGYASRVLHSSAGGGSAPFHPPSPPDGLAAWMQALEAAVVGTAVRDFAPVQATPAGITAVDPTAAGGDLYRHLFVDRVGDRFAYSRGRADADAETGLRLRLVLSPADDGGAALAALPWELLYDAEQRLFLGRSRLSPVVRCLDVPGPQAPPPVEPPLRVLGVLALPRRGPRLDLEAERRRVEEAWGRQPLVELTWLAAADLEALRRTLRSAPFQVLHFMGHGGFDEAGGEGALLFTDGAGAARPVPGPLLAGVLRDFPTLRLVFLNACETGRLPRRAGVDPYSGVAAALVAGGIPAVVAMQFPISDRAALTFSRTFYTALSDGDPVDAAVAEGRQAIHRQAPDGFEWATPVLFLRAADGHLVRGLVSEARVAPEIRGLITDVSEIIDEKTRGFVGRGFVFAAAQRFLAEAPRGYLRIEGDPGIGKTALAAELVRRHGHVHHFNRRSEGIVRPEAFLANVCAQLIAAYGLEHATLPPSALRDAGFLSGLLHEVSRRLPAARPCVLLVDALDEADGDAVPRGANPLFLPAHLPPRIYVVVTTRPGPATALRVDVPISTVPVEHDSAANLADVRELVEGWLGRPGIGAYLAARSLGEARFVDEMVQRSGGNFMYLSYLLPALDSGRLQQITLQELPTGLLAYYEQHWQLLQGEDEAAWLDWKLPVLETLAVAAEPIPFDLVAIGSGVGDRRRVRRALDLWRPFLHLVERRDEAGRPLTLYRIYHQSFREFLAERTDLGRAEGRLLEHFLAATEGAAGG